MSTLYPTVVLGIGTFGGNVVNLLRTLVFEELDQPGLPIFRFVHLSSHGENEFDPQPSNDGRDHDWERMHMIRCTQAAEDTERIRSILKRDRSDTVKEGIQEQGWKNWMDDNLLNMSVQSWEKGAGNNRMIGRCLLWNNWRRKAMVQAKLSNYIQDITNDVKVIRETNDIITHYYHRKEGQPPARDINYVHTQPRIYLIGSMCGGTGSGMFLDLAYFFRTQAAQDLKIFGTFSVPDTATCNAPARERLAANALAGLIELDYYMTDGTRYQERLPLESRLTDSDEKPFDFVQLISPRSINGKALGKTPVPNDETLDELAHIAASSLFFEMLSGTEVRKAAIHVDFGARHDEWMTAKPDDNGFLRGLSTFGAATAHYPKYRIAGAAACQIIKEKILAWSGRVVKSDRASGEEQERRKEHDGLPAKQIATKWFQTAYQRGQERFCLGESGTEPMRNEWMSEFNTIFFQKMTPKESDFRTLRDQMKLAPQGNPLANRFVAGGRYAKMLEGRLDGLREAMLDSLKENYSSALAQIISDDSVISGQWPQDLEHLQEVVSCLSGEVISEAQNKLPGMPTQPVSLSKMDNIFAEFERAEGSAAAWMVGARNAVREYYRRLILNQYQAMLQKANLDMELAFLGRVMPDLKDDLDKGIRDINTSMMSKIGLCIKYLQEHYRNLTRTFNYENMVMVVTDRQKGIEHDTQLCRNTFRANMWKEIFAEMQQLDGSGRSVKNQLIDPKSDHKSIVTRLIDLMVRKLMGRMEGDRPFDIVETLLSNYRLELFTMGKRSLVLLELTAAYRDIFAGDHPRLICGGDPNEVKRLTSTLNQEDIHDFDSAKIVGSSVNHMLHLYQEQAGMAVDDLQTYKSMHEHYRTYMRMGPEASPDTRILHTDRDVSRFDKRIFRRMADLKHGKNEKPSPFAIATEFLPDQFFSSRPVSATEFEDVFEWSDQGIERDEVYDPKNPEAFLLAISQSEAACRYFKERVQELIEQMEQDELIQRVNEIRSGLILEFGRSHQRVTEFDAAFNPEFVKMENFPWW
jgi:hypothetical protein